MSVLSWQGPLYGVSRNGVFDIIPPQRPSKHALGEKISRYYIDPFALCPALPDSLGGRDSTDYSGSAAPPMALATYPPTLLPGSQRRFRRYSHSSFSVSFRYPSVPV